MTDTTRRQFLRSAVQGAGATLLTAGLTGSKKPKVKPKPKTKTKTPEPKQQGLGAKAKAYRKFLRFITRTNYDVPKGGLWENQYQEPLYPRSQTGKESPSQVTSADRTLTLKEATGKTGRQIASTDQTRNLAREAFESSVAGKNKPVIKGSQTIHEVKHKFPSAELALKGKYKEKLKLRQTGSVVTPEDWSNEIKIQRNFARSTMAKEIRTMRSQRKNVTKRGIFEKIKNKLKTFKPRSGFGGPRPRKVGIGNQDPSRVSGYHY